MMTIYLVMNTVNGSSFLTTQAFECIDDAVKAASSLRALLGLSGEYPWYVGLGEQREEFVDLAELKARVLDGYLVSCTDPSGLTSVSISAILVKPKSS